MTPQEKDLIQKVFDRLANAGGAAKDAEAENFIQDQVRRQPDAAYGLTQAVIVLEAGMNQAEQKIADLQRQLDQARAGSSGSGSGFLGGSSPWGNSSVPRSGSVPQPQPQPQSTYYAPPPQPQAWPPAQTMAAPQASPWAQPSGGSSFLRNAATMAAGVAGGTLIAEGLSSMFGHHYGGGFGFGGGGYGGGFGGSPEIIEERVTVNNNYYDGDRGGSQSPTSGNDQTASYDDAGNYDDGGSGFDDGGDYGSDV